jgi:predicted dehydrogenase
MSEKLAVGILGCGDYLKRWQSGPIRSSKRIQVRALFDLDRSRAEELAAALGGDPVDSADAVLDDPDIPIVCLFAPPWVRRELVERAVEAGKHILATKPLGVTVEDCAAMVRAVEGNVLAGVQYRRTDDGLMECCRTVLDAGDLGTLVLYRQDWLHHYPMWNAFGVDPDRGGGPFMDAMIHNLNRARYLMDGTPTHATFFSGKLAHPDLPCSDTESMVVEFESGLADLFITWAADLAVYSDEGNDREHIDIVYMVTSEGWRLTEESIDGRMVIRASRGGEVRDYRPERLGETIYDAFARAVDEGVPLRRDLPTVREAYEDVRMVRDAAATPGVRIPVDLSLV